MMNDKVENTTLDNLVDSIKERGHGIRSIKDDLYDLRHKLIGTPIADPEDTTKKALSSGIVHEVSDILEEMKAEIDRIHSVLTDLKNII